MSALNSNVNNENDERNVVVSETVFETTIDTINETVSGDSRDTVDELMEKREKEARRG